MLSKAAILVRSSVHTTRLLSISVLTSVHTRMMDGLNRSVLISECWTDVEVKGRTSLRYYMWYQSCQLPLTSCMAAITSLSLILTNNTQTISVPNASCCHDKSINAQSSTVIIVRSVDRPLVFYNCASLTCKVQQICKYSRAHTEIRHDINFLDPNVIKS
jgi:hypothetical protein